MTNATHSVREARRLAERAAAAARDDTSINTSATQVLLDLARAVTELAGAVEELAGGGVTPNGASAAHDPGRLTHHVDLSRPGEPPRR